MKINRGVDIEIHIFLTSALLEVSGQLHAPASLPTGKAPPGTHWLWGWVDPRAGLDDLEKRKFLTLPRLQPVASLYTDYAIPAPRAQ
jgi:hypothetical protein